MPDTSGLEYVKSWCGLFKIGEFFCLLVSFSCLANFSSESENNGSFKFFLFVAISAWLITMLLFGMFASGFYQRISLNWTLAVLIYSALYSLLLLISTSLVAEKARKFRRGVMRYDVKNATGKTHFEYEDTCDYYSEKGSSCANVEASAVFAFIALGLFVADTLFYFMEYRGGSGPGDQSGFVQQDQTGMHHDYDRTDVEQIP